MSKKELQQKICDFAQCTILSAMDTGMTWDETVYALGIVVKSLTLKAVEISGDSEVELIANAMKRFNEAMSADIVNVTMKKH
jgi:hypothetical protein